MATHEATGVTGDVTALLQSWSSGNTEAREALLPKIYDELRTLAGSYMRRERPGHTLQPTALVHEAFLRLVGQEHIHWRSRAHFFGIAAQMMRRILVDHARKAGTARRGAGRRPLPLSEAANLMEEPTADVLIVDQALRALADVDSERSRLVELRFFAGLRLEEIAEVMGVSEATVSRRWRTARAWLFRYLSRRSGG